jgi:hypothetical protein
MKSINFIFLLFALILGFQQLSYAQDDSAPINDTLEDFLNVQNAHKDGYDFANQIIDIPSNIVLKYNKRKAKIIGIRQSFRIERPTLDDNGDTIVYQERNDDLRLSDGDKADTRKYIVETIFTIKSISIWDKQKRMWKTIFRENKN